MKYILISLLLCPLTMMAMQTRSTLHHPSSNPTLCLQSRLHYCELDPETKEQIPEPIVCSPVVRYFAYYGQKPTFFDRCDGTECIEILGTHLSHKPPYPTHYYPCRCYKDQQYPYYTMSASVLKLTKTSLRYECTVRKNDRTHNIHLVDIPLPTTYNAHTKVTLLFTSIDDHPQIIDPNQMTAEEKKSLLATLKPQCWINVKAEWEREFNKREREYIEPKHMSKDTDLD